MSAANSNQVRIIGGVHRGRRLHFSAAQGLRPTADRVRETLFNWLQFDVPGSRSLDLFAGSGVLGFEALSRGAASVTMVESQRKVMLELEKNAQLLGAGDSVNRIFSDALRWLDQGREPGYESFDIVFLDPPFNQNLLQPAIDKLEGNDWLVRRSLVYIEQDLHEQEPQLPGNWRVIRDKTAGQVRYRLIERLGSDSR